LSNFKNSKKSRGNSIYSTVLPAKFERALKTSLWGLSSPESPVALSGVIVRSGYMDRLIHRILSRPIKGGGSAEMTLHGDTSGAISILMKGVSANLAPHFAPPPPSFSNVVPVLFG
jgi:hypothetical protein